jgi:hypothetical protein
MQYKVPTDYSNLYGRKLTMKKLMKSLASIFTAAVLLTSCGQTGADTDQSVSDNNKKDISVYPEAGVVVQEVSAPSTNFWTGEGDHLNRNNHFNIVDYKEEILTKSFVGNNDYSGDAAISMQTSVSFKDIKDSTDAKIVRDLKKYLSPTQK